MNKCMNAVDLFAGCGGLSEGLRQAGFSVRAAIEINPDAVTAYKMNHPNTVMLDKDIRNISADEIKQACSNDTIHLLAGCPPCQSFSSMRRLNRAAAARDSRNDLVLEYLRLVRQLHPLTIMMENVPALRTYYRFRYVVNELNKLGYMLKVQVVNVCGYGVPQNRKRLVMVGSLLGELNIAAPTGEKITVRDAIGGVEPVSRTQDPIHRIYPRHTPDVLERIKLIPKDGGSRKDLPQCYFLRCHKRKNVGFNDVYGRLKWDTYSSTITGGCLNPSKGRFLHPTKNRCITAREAALLQSFPRTYQFPSNISKSSLALLIGNALPPKFSFYQAREIYKHIRDSLLI